MHLTDSVVRALVERNEEAFMAAFEEEVRRKKSKRRGKRRGEHVLTVPLP